MVNQNTRNLGRKKACFRVESDKPSSLFKPSFPSLVHYNSHMGETLPNTKRQRYMEKDRESKRDTVKHADRYRAQKKLKRNIPDDHEFRLDTASLS